MKISSLFDKYQRYIVGFSNTNLGKDYLGIRDSGKIIKVTPNSVHFLRDINSKGRPIIQARIISGNEFFDKFSIPLTQMEICEDNGFRHAKLADKDIIIPHHLGLILPKRYLPVVNLLTLAKNPDADPETTSVDGEVGRITTNEAFGTIRGGAGTNSFPANVGTYEGILVLCGSSAGGYDRFFRFICLYDTSSLTSSASISAGDVQIYVNYKFVSLGGSPVSVALVNTTPAGNTNLVDADYGQVGETQQASNVAYSSMSAGNTYTWTLNATGIASVSLTGITKFGLRDENDRANSAPSWSSGARQQISVNTAESASNKPVLNITYTLVTGGGAFYKSLLGVGF